jgi:hypothetical protein
VREEDVAVGAGERSVLVEMPDFAGSERKAFGIDDGLDGVVAEIETADEFIVGGVGEVVVVAGGGKSTSRLATVVASVGIGMR